MGSKVSYAETFRVPFADTDAAGVVFYGNYYRWFDRMTHELFRHIGQPLDLHMQSGQAPVVVESGCRFSHSVRYDDEVQLSARVASSGARSLRIEHEVSMAGTVAASGYEARVWVTIKGIDIQPTELPSVLRALLAEE